jgi:DNA-binding FrmR family transcriptional regulator
MPGTKQPAATARTPRVTDAGATGRIDAEHSVVDGDEDGAPRGYSSNKVAHLKRMARIEGQVRGIARMIDEDKYCIDVLTQVSAATRALQAVSLALLDEHMAHCVANAVAAGPDEGAAKLKEASDAIARLVKS